MAALAVLLVLAVIVVAVVLISKGTSTTVHYEKVVGSHVQQAINQMQHLIDKYTK
jgi:beta-lactam-binding protein with PASTA domain